ncbi:MAG TPA: phage tail tape measure protein [Polyangiaceae bacterium]|nr:phage tail tape measure protein [Polyangiaceae bacterium]
MAIGAGAAVAGLGIKSVVDTGAEFEQAIADVGAVSLMTAAQVGDLRSKSLELGAATRYSATQVARGFESMGRAGFNNEQMLSGISGILSAAAAEGAEIEETADTVSAVLKGMRLDQGDLGAEANRVANVLALASARTKASLLSLGESMKTLGPTAAQFNIPLETAVGMVSLLQDAGLDASQAGTNLATALTRITNPAEKTTKLMAALGIKFEDTKGNMKSAAEIMAEMTKALAKSKGNYKQAATFAQIFGIDSQKAIINLENMFKTGRAQGLIKELTTTTDAADTMAKLRMDTFLGDWEQLGGAIDTLKINMFSLNSGALRELVQGTTEWLNVNGAAYAQLVGMKFGELMKEWVPLAIDFGRGMIAGGRELQLWARWAGELIPPLGWLFGDGTKAENAMKLGKAVVVVGGAFFAARVVVKGAEAAMWAFELAAKTVHGTTWLVTWATRAMSGATLASTANLGAAKVAAFATAGGLGALALAAGAAALAVGAVYMANEELKKQTQGMGILDIASDMWTQGTWDPFKVVDRHQNELARAKRDAERNPDSRLANKASMVPQFDVGSIEQLTKMVDQQANAASVTTTNLDEFAKSLEQVNTMSLGSDTGAPPQMISPQERTASRIEERQTTVKSELTIRDETGRAEMTKEPPPGAPLGVRLNRSGDL